MPLSPIMDINVSTAISDVTAVDVHNDGEQAQLVGVTHVVYGYGRLTTCCTPRVGGQPRGVRYGGTLEVSSKVRGTGVRVRGMVRGTGTGCGYGYGTGVRVRVLGTKACLSV